MHSIDVNEQNFQSQVLEASNNVPVVVDFWAPWCGPCKTLKPLLEKLAEEYQGKFILAKVNSDENQSLAAQFGVRGIPSVKAVFQGKLIDEFSGALPESEVRSFLNRIIPNESEIKRQQAMELTQQGKNQEAISLLEESLQLNPENHQAKIDLAGLATETNELQTARDLIKSLPANLQQDDQVKEIITKIDLREQTSDLPDKQVLIDQINDDQNNLQARVDLANVYIAEQNYDDALEVLFELITKDRDFGDDIGRKTMLSIFTLLGNQDDRVRSARRRLATLLN